MSSASSSASKPSPSGLVSARTADATIRVKLKPADEAAEGK